MQLGLGLGFARIFSAAAANQLYNDDAGAGSFYFDDAFSEPFILQDN